MGMKSSSDVVGKAVTIEDTQTQGPVLYTEDGAVRRLPVPSSDPNDPLNFSPRRHRLVLTVLCVYGITGFGSVQSTALFFGKLVPEYVQKTHGVSFSLSSFLRPLQRLVLITFISDGRGC
jgi:hypothetical protein